MPPPSHASPPLAEAEEAASQTSGSRAGSSQRVFRIVFAVLTVHFASLALICLADPELAVRRYSDANELFGGVAFAFSVAGLVDCIVVALMGWSARRAHASLDRDPRATSSGAAP